MDCDWQLPINDVPYYSILLPEIQQSRDFGRILAARARIQMADGQYEDSISTLRTGFALGRNVARGETLVQGLVGNVICELMAYQLLDLLQQPKAPNLYWALTVLPYPLINVRAGLDVERMALELSYPELHNSETANLTPDQWRAQYLRIFSQELGLQLGMKESPKWPSADQIEERCKDRLDDAKRFLIRNGLGEDAVQKMAPYQVASIYSLQVFHAYLDDAAKVYNLPYRVAAASMDETINRLRRDRVEIVPVAERDTRINPIDPKRIDACRSRDCRVADP